MIHTYSKLLPFALLLLVCCSRRKAQSDGTAATAIKVMTYNVHHCNPPQNKDRIDVDAIAAVIKQQDADVVAVQEVDVNTGRSGGINQAEQLAKKAGYPSFYFAKAMDFDGGQYGVLILSKYILTNTTTCVLPKAAGNGGEPRVLALATVALPGGRAVRFGSTHLEAYNRASRLLQVKKINDIAAGDTMPFIVAGDFNAKEGSEVINVLDEQFMRTCMHCPATFAEETDTGAIDFIAVTPGASFRVLSHQVVAEQQASDHMPVVATIALK